MAWLHKIQFNRSVQQMEKQLELFHGKRFGPVDPRQIAPNFDEDVWKRASGLLKSHGNSALLMLDIRLSDDILSDEDQDFFIEVRRAIKWMNRWGGPIVH